MKRTKMLLGFWLRMIIFALILCVTLCYTVYVLTPKQDYGICPIINLYHQEEDTVDGTC